MKTIRNNPPNSVFVGEYNHQNFRRLLKRIEIGKVHYFIDEIFIKKETIPRYRSYLELKESSDSRNYVRRANLMELIHYAIKNPETVSEHHGIIGYDQNLCRLKNKYNTNLVVPLVFVEKGKINIDLIDEDTSIFFDKLVAMSIRNCSIC